MNRKDEMSYYSASRAELGDNARQITWQNSLDNCDVDNPDADPILLKTGGQLENVKSWFADFGAWDDEEIEDWDNQTVNALLLQFIAGDIREMEHYDSYEEYQIAAKRGSCSGRIYRADDNKWFIYVGN